MKGLEILIAAVAPLAVVAKLLDGDTAERAEESADGGDKLGAHSGALGEAGLDENTLFAPLTYPGSITMKPVDSRDISLKGWNEFQVFSVNQYNKWTEHCKGFICLEMQDGRPARLPTSKPEPFGGYSRLLDPAELYASLRAVEIYHGPTFQNLDKVRVCDGRSLSMLSIPDVAAIMPANYQSPLVIHPTMLDAIFVSAYSAILECDSRQDNPKVPRSIHSLWISNNISTTAGHKYHSYVNIHSEDSNGFNSTVHIANSNDGEPISDDVLVVPEGLACQSLGGGVPLQPEAHKHDICSKVEWRPDISFMENTVLKQEVGFPIDPTEMRIIIDLRRACFHYIRQALSLVTVSDVQGLEKHPKKYYTWMKSQLASAARGELAASTEKLCAAWGHSCTPSSTAVKFDRAAIQVGKIMKHLTYKNPRLRILEIGAGTGGSTRRALEAIGNGIKSGYGPMAAEYHFTDISSGLFGEARAQFEDWRDIMSYRKLGIEQDPASQGFELGSFDVIIASQVLHATTSMKTTMTHVRSLLKDGGKLVLMESTKNQMDMRFVFGTLPGWWLSMEKEREFSPILPLPLWNSVLKDASFTGVGFEVQDCESDDIYTFSVVISTAQGANTSVALALIAIVTGQDLSPEEHGWLGALHRSVAIEYGVQPEIQSLQSVNADNKIFIFVGEMRHSVLTEPSQEQFKNIRSLALQCDGLFWVTRGGAEIVSKTFISFDLDPSSSILSIEDALLISRVFASRFNPCNVPEAPRDFEFAERENQVLIPRLQKDFERNDFVATDNLEPEVPVTQLFHQADRTLELRAGTTGLLETLAFDDVDMNSANPLPPACIEVQPRAFGLNFRDVMAAMGQLQEKVMGLECAGVITRVGDEAASKGYKVGDRVFCLLIGQFQNVIQVPWTSACSMPIGMDFGTAASIPMIFATANIGLYDTARLSKNKSVLIHAATGDVGQAAIHLAKLAGSETFATAGTQEKRDLLVNMYGIPADHVFSSRDASLAKEIMKITNNSGVNIVLNSLSGQLLQEGFSCLAPCGHFVEIGKFDIEHNHRLALATFSKAVSFSSIDPLAMVRREDDRIHQVLASITKLFEQKRLEAVQPVMVYPLSDIKKAFRQMQTGKHIGKIVLSVEPGETIKALPRQPVVKLRQDASYLIIGGVGGIGKSIARWMLNNGAKNLILLSRSAGAGSAAAECVAELKAAHPGSEIMGMGCDISDKLGLTKVLQLCELRLPPVRGVIQAAMVFQDSVLEGMTLANYNAALRPKVHGSRNLHELLGSDLEFFVMLSSLAGILDSLARHRAAKGLPGVSIDLGGVKEAAQRKGSLEGDRVRNPEPPRAAALGHPHRTRAKVCLRSLYILTREARLAGLSYIRPSSGNEGESRVDSAAAGLVRELQLANMLDEAALSVLQALMTKLVEIFMIPQEEIVSAKPLSSFGVDSLVAVELRNMLALQAEAQVSIFEIMQSPSLDALSTTVAASSTYVTVAR
ncbi:hypothetical protein NLG97_g4971 [Lecanicillium saksenae]|uniref:Uncharacterized protein n=1 Tax=Lecanicillium saksenae TaxID=468837 RepID=A0ACC1QUC0_9HYPO|nr:hypothetical protein NLG97_g4971 [Lecanicillium saksenae]